MDHDLPHIQRVSTYGAKSREAESLRRAAARGALHKVHRGCFVDSSRWAALKDRERHVLLVRAIAPSLAKRFVWSHASAAALLGWPSREYLPHRVHVIDPSGAPPQSRRWVVRHAAALAPSEIVRVDGFFVTAPARTAVDLASVLPFVDAIVPIDYALHVKAVKREQLFNALEGHPGESGRVAAARAIHFADPRSESAAESFCRVVLHELGAPVPELQRSFPAGTGTAGRVDFFFSEQGVVLEADGLEKYRGPEYLKGSSSYEAVIAERRREERLFAQPEIRAIVRCEWRDFCTPARLRAKLVGAGVPVA